MEMLYTLYCKRPHFISDIAPGSITKHATMASHPTRCAHTLSQKENSILSLAASDRYLFSGSQDLHIYVGIVRVFLDACACYNDQDDIHVGES